MGLALGILQITENKWERKESRKGGWGLESPPENGGQRHLVWGAGLSHSRKAIAASFKLLYYGKCQQATKVKKAVT